MERKFLTPSRTEEDKNLDVSLRPKRLDEFIGQKNLKENLKVFIKASKRRGEAMDHVLILGPPGMGKTTLAYIISNELSVGIKATSGPVLERAGDLAAILTDLGNGDVLFIDEIHRMNHVVEEILYPALEDYRIDIIVGQGPTAKSIKMPLSPFTLVGATTRQGLLTSPLLSRFGIHLRLEKYSIEDMTEIVLRSARILKVQIDDKGAREIAKRSRGTPRIANRLLRRVRDFAEVEGKGIVTRSIAAHALERLEVDENGFDSMDRKLLLTIIQKFKGGPVGIKTLSAILNEPPDTIEEVYEPFLLQIGFLERTERGRIATDLAYDYFGIKKNTKAQKRLI